MNPSPALRKARRLEGKTLVFRDAGVADAPFILALRTDPKKGQHLSATPAAISDQQAWLRGYADRDTEAYFIIEDRTGEPLGTVRLYDARGDSFCWGSWILKDGAPAAAAIESALMVYAYALDTLGFSGAHFDVRRDNERVWSFHERFGAQRVSENERDIDYEISNEAIRASMRRFQRYLPNPLLVEPTP